MGLHAPASQVRPFMKYQIYIYVAFKKFKCPHNQRREDQLCSFGLLAFRATTYEIGRLEKLAVLLPQQRPYCDPCFPPLWYVEGTAVSLILPWWWWW